MEISSDQLRGFAAAKRPAPAPRVEPLLSLGEQLVVMTAGLEHRKVPTIVGLSGEAYGQPRDYNDAVQSLERSALITRSGLMRHVVASEAARVADRWKRVGRVVRDVAEPSEDDADLLLALAACDALKLNRDDHLRARHHIGALLSDGQPTRFAQLVRDEFSAPSMAVLAEELLPPDRHFSPGDFDPGMNDFVVWTWIYGAC